MNLPSFITRWFSRAAEPPSGVALPSPRHQGPLDEAVIRAWLASKLAGVLGATPEEVDPACTFTDYGLDSMQAVRLSGDVESWLGRELSPLLLYDYPSIETLARYLAEHGTTEKENASLLSEPAAA